MVRGPQAIRAEVEAWDPSGLPATFQLARHVLLHEDDQATALMNRLLTDGELTQDDINTWPLFDLLLITG